MKKKKNRKNVLKLIAANTLEKAIYSIFNNNDDESQRMEDNIRSKPSSSPSTVNDLEEQQIILNNIEQILHDSQFTTNVINEESIRVNNITKKVKQLNLNLKQLMTQVNTFNTENIPESSEKDTLKHDEVGKRSPSSPLDKLRNMKDLEKIIKNANKHEIIAEKEEEGEGE